MNVGVGRAVKMASRLVYLDYNATTPLAPEVLEAITVTLKDAWGNPSSSYRAGVAAKRYIEGARESVGRMIGAKKEDIVFTSGGTESNNMVFDSIARHYRNTRGEMPHVVVSNIEHDSVSLTVQKMQEQGKIEVSTVLVSKQTGAVVPREVLSALRPNTALVSIMLANNETGIVQPVGEVVRVVREWEEGRRREEEGGREGGRPERIYFHTDAAQVLGKLPVDVSALGVDYLTIVGHKFYGPRIGALFVLGMDDNQTPLYPMLYGGGQERGFRPGTENTGMIAGLGKAADLIASNITSYEANMRMVRDYLEEQLKVHFGDLVCFNGRFAGSERIPNTCNVSLVGEKLKGNVVLSRLKHTQASVGAACHSSSVATPSPCLLAVGVTTEVALNALRLSVGRETSTGDVDVVIADLKNAVFELTGKQQ